MIRRITAVVAGTVAWMGLLVMPAHAQASAAPTAPSGAVTVDGTGVFGSHADTGVLVRAGSASAAPMMAVYVGLSLVGATLAAITARRRLLSLKATELATGVVIGRRARTEFWGAGPRVDRALARVGGEGARFRPAATFRPAARSHGPLLVRSRDTVTIAEHGSPARAGFAGGISDG